MRRTRSNIDLIHEVNHYLLLEVTILVSSQTHLGDSRLKPQSHRSALLVLPLLARNTSFTLETLMFRSFDLPRRRANLDFPSLLKLQAEGPFLLSRGEQDGLKSLPDQSPQ
jgi:hypothetical protein